MSERHPQRTVVVTGASAGVGRAVALEFAQHGWRVATIARSADGLNSLRQEIESSGGEAADFPLDVAEAPAVFRAAEQIVARWGVIDIWINNAMVTMYSPVAKMSPEEFRRITEVTYLGYVHGTMAALMHMRRRNAGTIVQVGSALSYRAIPLQSAYCGAKFAVRGFTDALRSELLHDESAISLTMVQLPAVNTPQFDWARNKMERRAQPVPPVYQPEAVAKAIFQAACFPRREFWLGLPTLKAIAATIAAPTLMDRYLARNAYKGQITDEPQPADTSDNLFDTPPAGHVTRGRFDDRARSHIRVFNPAALRGWLAALVIAGVGAMFAAVFN